MLADSIHDIVRISRINLYRHMEDGVAGLLMRMRNHFHPLHERGVLLIFIASPNNAVVLTSVDKNRRVIRVNDRQIHPVKVLDIAVFVKDSVAIGTGRIEGVRNSTRVRAFPYIRVFLIRMYIQARVVGADEAFVALLRNNAQRADTVAAVRGDVLHRVTVSTAGCDMVSSPVNTLPVMQNDYLCVLFDSREINLHINNTVAYRACVMRTDRIAVKRIQGHARFSVLLAADPLRVTLADVILLGRFRRFVNRKMQTIDTIGVMDALIAVLILLGRADCMLQLIADMLDRAPQPMER